MEIDIKNGIKTWFRINYLYEIIFQSLKKNLWLLNNSEKLELEYKYLIFLILENYDWKWEKRNIDKEILILNIIVWIENIINTETNMI